MDKERNMNTKADEKQWILVCVPLSKVANQNCHHKYHAHGRFDCTALYFYTLRLLCPTRAGAVPRQSTPVLKYDPLKLVSHVVQKRHDDTQETQKQSKGLFTWR